MGNIRGAREDFEESIAILNDLTSRGTEAETVGTGGGMAGRINKEDAALMGVRLNSLRALCFLDAGLYNAGHDVLTNTLALVNEIEAALLAGKTITECLVEMAKNQALQEQRQRRHQRLTAVRTRHEEAQAAAHRVAAQLCTVSGEMQSATATRCASTAFATARRSDTVLIGSSAHCVKLITICVPPSESRCPLWPPTISVLVV